MVRSSVVATGEPDGFLLWGAGRKGRGKEISLLSLECVCRVCASLCVSACMCVCMTVGVNVYVCACMCTYVWVCEYAGVHICVCECVCVECSLSWKITSVSGLTSAQSPLTPGSHGGVQVSRGRPPQLARAASALPAAASTLGSAVGPVGGVAL